MGFEEPRCTCVDRPSDRPHDFDCPWSKRVMMLTPQQRKVRLLHKNGLAFDFIVGKDFNLQATVTSIRANGFLLVPERCYIPESEIGMIFMLQGEIVDKPAQVIPFPDNPKP